MNQRQSGPTPAHPRESGDPLPADLYAAKLRSQTVEEYLRLDPQTIDYYRRRYADEQPHAFPLTETERKIEALLRTEIGRDPAKRIFRAERLSEDLGIDSLDHVELMIAAEETFDIVIGDDAAEAVKTVGDLCDLVAALAPARAQEPANGAAA